MIVGNLTRDPELKYTPSGRPVCSFGVATNRRWKDPDGNQKEEVEFHDVVAWGKLAEIISQFLKKGNKIYIEGRIRTRNWEGQDGVKRYRTEIIAENFIPLTPKGTAPGVEAITDTEPPSEKTEEKSDKPATAGKPSVEDKDKKKKDKAADKEEIDLDEIPF